MSDAEKKASELIEKANKKLKGWSLFGSTSKYEDAVDLLENAANNLKIAKSWRDAAETYKQLAGIQNKLGSRHEEATNWVEAAKAYKKIPSDEAVMCLNNAVEIYTDMGRLNQAARSLRDIAEQWEKQDQLNSAIEFYSKAADLFMTEDSTAEGNKCRLKVAQFEAQLGRYKEAVEIYEDIARQAVEHNLLKYSAKGYLLNAGICRMCYAEPESVPAALERYKEIDVTFNGSRECNFLENLSEALVKEDEQKFSDEVAQYDALSRLDEWKTTILLCIKRRIQDISKGLEDDHLEDLT